VVVLTALAAAACGGTVSQPPPPTPAVCGNGQLEAGEECDDGNGSNADACLTTCRTPAAWFPSDVHVHTTGCGAYGRPADTERLLREQGIRVASVLVWGDGFSDDAPYFTGRDYATSASDLLMHYDMEVSALPADTGGHLLLLGLDSLNYSSDIFRTPRSGVPVIDSARRTPRVVVGMAHGQFWPTDGRFPRPPVVCCMPWEFAVHAARGKLDFLSVERLPAGQAPVDDGTWMLWRSAENSGLRVAITGASDYPCVTRVGSLNERTPRTDVIVDGELTYEHWLEAIKAGRTTTSIGYGTRLNLRVDNVRLGGEVRVPAGREVTVTVETVEAASAPVQVLVNGVVAATLNAEPGAQVGQVKLTMDKSAWIVARSPHVLTSPVYVVVDGKPVRASADDTCYLIRYVDHLTDLVTSRRLDMRESADEALAAYAEARTELVKRFQEAGGTECR
jgi:cysteine-rich repeat protein